ncbi:MAG: lipoate--protein ligase family protein [Acidobacteria bacterium]|nr:lipoate--protein ligase family protein [Acidobacteriota bacterium]
MEPPIQSNSWSVLLDGPRPGSFNMALDEVLLDHVSHPQCLPATYLRFYQWVCPTLSLGFSQKAERVVNQDYCKAKGISVVRRPTGGKAVLHHREVTYSVVSNDAAFFPIADISETYGRIARALQSGFRFLGIETTLATDCGRNTGSGPLPAACFAVANHHEILWQNRKLAGSAQRRTKSGFLQHGSILIEFDAALLSGALRLGDPISVASRVTDLNTCLHSPPTTLEVISAMLRGFEAIFGAHLQPSKLGQGLAERAGDLAERKYSILDWSDLCRQVRRVE